jgi:hypothetical protein
MGIKQHIEVNIVSVLIRKLQQQKKNPEHSISEKGFQKD